MADPVNYELTPVVSYEFEDYVLEQAFGSSVTAFVLEALQKECAAQGISTEISQKDLLDLAYSIISQRFPLCAKEYVQKRFFKP